MIICIVGPTGVGKTAVSVSLAKKINAEVISGDSVQVYKDLNIGSAKVTKEEMDGVVHHLIDICEIEDEYSTSVFQQMARACIKDIESRGKNVIICGGTGYYIKACLYDYKFQAKRDDSPYDNYSNEELFKMLEEADPTQAKLLHPNNRIRVLRALDLATKGEKISENQDGDIPLYDFKLIGLTKDRDKVYEGINKRVDIMLEKGLMDEVKALYPKKEYIHAIGYNEFFDYLDNKCSFEEAVEKVKQNSRKYAKRQYTWFNNKMDTTWVMVEGKSIEDITNEIIEIIK